MSVFVFCKILELPPRKRQSWFLFTVPRTPKRLHHYTLLESDLFAVTPLPHCELTHNTKFYCSSFAYYVPSPELEALRNRNEETTT